MDKMVKEFQDVSATITKTEETDTTIKLVVREIGEAKSISDLVVLYNYYSLKAEKEYLLRPLLLKKENPDSLEEIKELTIEGLTGVSKESVYEIVSCKLSIALYTYNKLATGE